MKENITTSLEEYRAFNPAVQFYKGSTFMIIREHLVRQFYSLVLNTEKERLIRFVNRCYKIEFFGEGRKPKLQKWQGRMAKEQYFRKKEWNFFSSYVGNEHSQPD